MFVNEFDLSSLILHFMAGGMLYVLTYSIMVYQSTINYLQNKKNINWLAYWVYLAGGASLMPPLFAGIIKELYDLWDYGVFNYGDILSTMLGATFTPLVLYFVFMYIQDRMEKK